MSDRHTEGKLALNAFDVTSVIIVADGPDREGRTYQDGRHQYTVFKSGDIPDLDERIANAERLLLTWGCHDDLRDALKGLLKNYDPERAVIDVEPEPSCIECTSGATPNHLNKGPCAYHKSIAALARGAPLMSDRHTEAKEIWDKVPDAALRSIEDTLKRESTRLTIYALTDQICRDLQVAGFKVASARGEET